MSIEHLRAGVVGTGFIGAVHVEALRRLGVEVVGVVGSSPERAKGKRLAPVIESYERLLDDERVDVVHLTTPNHLHAQQVKQALAAGKHVVCEKPLALTSEESAELLELARQRRRPLHQLQHPLLSAGPAGSGAHCRRRRRQRLERPRRLPSGLAAPADRLELAPRARQGRRAEGSRRHRFALARSRAVRDRQEGRVGARRPRNDDSRPAQADPRDRDLRVRGRRRAGRRADDDRGSRAHPPALRGRHARLAGGLAGERRPQELAPVRGRRLERLARVGLGAERGALAGPPRQAERAAPRATRRCSSRRRAGGRLSPPGTRKASPRRSRSSTAPSTRPWPQAGRRTSPTTRPSPPATGRTSWATPSRSATVNDDGWR